MELMNLNAKRGEYPYSRRRVLLSTIVAILSTMLAVMLLLYDPNLLLYYFFSTLAIAAITFFIKRRFYRLLVAENSDTRARDEQAATSRKTLLATFLVLIGSFMVPLLLVRLLGGAIWVVMITSYAAGVSFSEVALYMQAQGLDNSETGARPLLSLG
jgi:hypothetical protein